MTGTGPKLKNVAVPPGAGVLVRATVSSNWADTGEVTHPTAIATATALIPCRRRNLTAMFASVHGDPAGGHRGVELLGGNRRRVERVLIQMEKVDRQVARAGIERRIKLELSGGPRDPLRNAVRIEAEVE